MRGSIKRSFIVSLQCLLLVVPLREGELAAGELGEPAVAESDKVAPSESESPPTPDEYSTSRPPAGPVPRPPANSVPPNEDASPFTDAYPPTVDNLSGRGLFNLLDPFPLAVLHLQLPVNTLRILEEDQGRFEVNFHWANNYVLEDNVTIDAETYTLELGGWYALRSDFYVGASISLLARDGGVLDGFVDGFHDTFGLSDADRSKRSNNAYEISIIDDQGETRSLDRGIGAGDFVLRTHWNVSPGDKWFPAVAIEAFMTLPTSTNGFGSSAPDLGMTVSFYKTIYEDLHLYAVLGGTLITNTRVEGIKYRKSVLQATVGIEYVLLDDLSIIAQHMSYSGLLDNPSPLDKHRNYIAGGIKWEFVEGYTLEFSVVENLHPFENSSDIAFNLGFQFTF